MTEVVAGVDLGTTGTKAALYTVDGELLAEASEATPGAGGHQEAGAFYTAATRTLASCAARVEPGRVRAIAVCGQMAGVMGVDARR